MSAIQHALIRVVPSPVTLAESSAILQHIKSWGIKVEHFNRADKNSTGQKLNHTEDATYLISFEQPLSDELKNFEVFVHHDHDESNQIDPQGIRGLSDRKPFPKPRLLKCTIGTTQPSESQVQQILQSNPYRGHFHVAKPDIDDNYETLIALGAPRGIARRLNRKLSEKEVAEKMALRESRADQRRPAKRRPIPMDSLRIAWREAQAEREVATEEQMTREKSMG